MAALLLILGCFSGCTSQSTAGNPAPTEKASLPTTAPETTLVQPDPQPAPETTGAADPSTAEPETAATQPDTQPAPETTAAAANPSTAEPETAAAQPDTQPAPETAAATDAPTTEPEAPETETPQLLPEGTLTSAEQVADYLAQCREAGVTEIDFTCSESLFEALQADRFSLMRILMLKGGVDSEIRYSASSHRIVLQNVSYTDANWAECSTELAVKQAFLQFAAENAESFSLICPEELISSLRSGSKLLNFAAQAGWSDANWRSSGGILEVSDFVPFDEPYAVVEDAAQFAAAVEGFAEQNLTSFYIVREQKFRDQLREDDLAAELMLAGSMLEKYGGTSTSSGIYHYTGVQYTYDPKLFCYNEADIVSGIRQMGAIGASSFRIYLVGSDLILPVCSENFRRLHELEAEAGMSTSQMAYSFSQTLREIQYSEARIVADAVSLSTAAEAIAYVNEKVQSGAGEITLFCSEALYKELIGNLDNQFSMIHNGMTPIYDLLAHCGVYDYDLMSSRASHTITIQVKHLYPGAEIFRAVQSGAEGDLEPRLQQTLREAQAIADACKSSDPLQTAEKIHDAVCERVTYETLEEKSDNDTAVGVLLNGKADCDGYSDAFYLIGSLAGLHVRYQHGNGVNTGFYGFGDSATHMWNLLELDGSWRMVDVTWDDSSDAIGHTWFNLGSDRAARSHRWNAEMTVPLLEKTDLSKRPESEFSVTSAEQLEQAIETAITNQYPRFTILFDEEAYQDRQSALDMVRKQIHSGFSYSWNAEMRMLTITLNENRS